MTQDQDIFINTQDEFLKKLPVDIKKYYLDNCPPQQFVSILLYFNFIYFNLFKKKKLINNYFFNRLECVFPVDLAI